MLGTPRRCIDDVAVLKGAESELLVLQQCNCGMSVAFSVCILVMAEVCPATCYVRCTCCTYKVFVVSVPRGLIVRTTHARTRVLTRVHTCTHTYVHACTCCHTRTNQI